METIWYSMVELIGFTQLKCFIQLLLIQLAAPHFLSPSEMLTTTQVVHKYYSLMFKSFLTQGNREDFAVNISLKNPLFPFRKM